MNINSITPLFYYNKENIKPKYTLVESLLQTCTIVRDILLKESILAIDCEGILLSKEGRLTLIQISLADQRVFIFDILKGGSLMFLGLDLDRPGLKSVLENKRILKLLHDCRNDWDSLLYQYSVRLFGFIDTQEAYSVYDLFIHQNITLPISLMSFINIFCNEPMNKKQQIKLQMQEDHTIWGKRPINENMIIYACEDVLYLIKAWERIKLQLNDYLIEIIKVLSIFKVVDSDMFNEFSDYLTRMFMENYQLVNEGRMNFQMIAEVDYVYSFFKMKNKESACNESGSIIVKQGYDYKKKQRVICFQEMMNQYKQTRRLMSDERKMTIDVDINKNGLLLPYNIMTMNNDWDNRFIEQNINNNVSSGNYYFSNNNVMTRKKKPMKIDMNNNINKELYISKLRHKEKNKHNKRHKRKEYTYNKNNNYFLNMNETPSITFQNKLSSTNKLPPKSKTSTNIPKVIIIFNSDSTAISNTHLNSLHSRLKSISYIPSQLFHSNIDNLS